MSKLDEFWEREGEHRMSRSTFMGWTVLWTIAGIAVTAAATAVGTQLPLPVSGWGRFFIFIGIFVVTQAGVAITLSNDKPVVSLTGFALVAVPFGILLGPIVAATSLLIVVRSLVLTTLITAVFGYAGARYPKSLEGWQVPLIIGLFVLIIGYFGLAFAASLLGAGLMTAFTIWEILGVILFCFMLVYDFNRAMHVPRTLDNAIDCALAVYLDFLNIFIRLLGVQRR